MLERNEEKRKHRKANAREEIKKSICIMANKLEETKAIKISTTKKQTILCIPIDVEQAIKLRIVDFVVGLLRIPQLVCQIKRDFAREPIKSTTNRAKEKKSQKKETIQGAKRQHMQTDFFVNFHTRVDSKVCDGSFE